MDSLEFFIDSILGFRGEIGARSMRIMSPTFGGNDHDHHLAPRRLKARARLNKAVRKIGLTSTCPRVKLSQNSDMPFISNGPLYGGFL